MFRRVSSVFSLVICLYGLVVIPEVVSAHFIPEEERWIEPDWILSYIGNFASDMVKTLVGPNASLSEFYRWNVSSNWFKQVFYTGLNLADNRPKVIAVIACTLLLAFAMTFTAVGLYLFSIKMEFAPEQFRRKGTFHKKDRLPVRQIIKRTAFVCAVFAFSTLVIFMAVVVLSAASAIGQIGSNSVDEADRLVKALYDIKNRSKAVWSKFPVEYYRMLGKRVEDLLVEEISYKEGLSWKVRQDMITFRALSFTFEEYMAKLCIFIKQFPVEMLGMAADFSKTFTDVISFATSLPEVENEILQDLRNARRFSNEVYEQLKWLNDSLNSMECSEKEIQNLTDQVVLSVNDVEVIFNGFNLDNVDLEFDFRKNILHAVREKEKLLLKLFNLIDFYLPAQKFDKFNSMNKNTKWLCKSLSVVLPLVAYVAMSLVFPIVVGTLLGLAGTNCVDVCIKPRYTQTELSHSGGNIMESGLYVASMFVWMYAFMSPLCLIFSLTPTAVCMELNNPVPMSFENISTQSLSMYQLQSLFRSCQVNRSVVYTEDFYTLYAIKRDYHPVSQIQKLQERVKKLPLVSNTLLDTVGKLVTEFQAKLVTKANVLKNITRKILLCREWIMATAKVLDNGFDVDSDYETFKFALALVNLDGHAIKISNMVAKNATELKGNGNAMVKTAVKIFDKLVDKIVHHNHFLQTKFPGYVNDTIDKRMNVSGTAREFVSDFYVHHRDAENNLCEVLAVFHKRICQYTCLYVQNGFAMLWMSTLVISIALLIAILFAIPTLWMFKLPMSRSKERYVAPEIDVLSSIHSNISMVNRDSRDSFKRVNLTMDNVGAENADRELYCESVQAQTDYNRRRRAMS